MKLAFMYNRASFIFAFLTINNFALPHTNDAFYAELLSLRSGARSSGTDAAVDADREPGSALLMYSDKNSG